jgi:putative acyl-CoA dehydrogenase
MCDAFLTLAKTPGVDTPSCFLVPRWKPDGERNHGFLVMRLKDKLADRANASSEVEYHDAWGMMIGEEGKGVRTIIEMVQATRLDCTLGSAGGARRALQIALNHAVCIFIDQFIDIVY